MKKALWIILLFLALGSVFWFVGKPLLESYLQAKQIPEPVLKGAETAQDSFAKEGWVREEKFVYQRRDIPSLEKEFEELGYPPFLYLADKDGTVGRNAEKSYHEDGMAVFLYMDETYYMTHARLEYTVPSDKFSSTAMNENVLPFCDFAGIITGREVTDKDRDLLIREFAGLFNDAEHKPRKVLLNDLSFSISLDGFYMLLQMSC